jgi:MoxR-like ATPase
MGTLNLSMKPRELKELLLKAMEHKKPVLVTGGPGTGKSDIFFQVADELDMHLVLTHPVVSDPTDFKGMPAIVNGKAEFLPFGDLRKLIEVTEPTICFLDDLGQAPQAVQAAAMQLLLARRVNGHKVSDHVVFVAATNRRKDRAGVTGILEPVKSRFKSIIELQPDVEDWVAWAIENDMPPEIIAFVRFRPELLYNDDGATSEIVNHPCPRTMAAAGEWINIGVTDVKTLAGAIGAGAAGELVAFMKLIADLPVLASIIKDPDNAMVPKETAAVYATVSGLAKQVTVKNFANIVKYSYRLPQDMSVYLVRDCIRKEPKVQNTKAFNDWAVEHQDIMV